MRHPHKRQKKIIPEIAALAVAFGFVAFIAALTGFWSDIGTDGKTLAREICAIAFIGAFVFTLITFQFKR